MKKNVLALLALGALFFTGCNSIGDKDTIVGRVNGESVFQEDIDFMMRMNGESRMSRKVVESVASLFSRKAVYSKAFESYPELKQKLAENNSAVENYLLTFTYQRFYAMDRLMFSDDELKAYYDAHRSAFSDTSSYMEVRSQVAEKLYLERHADSLNAYIDRRKQAGDSLASQSDLEKGFLMEFRQKIMRETGDSLMKVYNIKEQPIILPSAEAFYEKHKDRYMTQPGFEVYHVEMNDSLEMLKLFADSTMDLETFKKIARENSLNKETATKDGYVGKVLETHVLPYGIGDMTPMFAIFKDKAPGAISTPIRTFMGETFHVFYMVAPVEPRQKTFEQARAAIKNELENGVKYDLDSTYVLVTKNDVPVVLEKDVELVYSENFGMVRNRQTHQRVVHSLAMNAAFAAEARKLKLDHSWEYRALVRESNMDLILKAFERKVKYEPNHPDDTLKAVFDKIGNPSQPGLDFEMSRVDLSHWLNMPRNVMKRMYYYRLEDFEPESYDSSLFRLFSETVVNYRNALWDKVSVDAWGHAKVSLYDDKIKLLSQEQSLQVALNGLDSLYNAHLLDKALVGWTGLRDRYPENDTLMSRATYEIAHIESELEDFNKAQREYRAFYNVWPDHPDAEKALFSRGFILTENLHKDSLALAVFDEFKAKYPKSELMESVDWLVENIKSGGKLADDLMKKISEE